MSLPSSVLERHLATDPVAFSASGEMQSAAQLLADVRAVAAHLPAPPAVSARGLRSQVVVACRDRYRFAAGLLAAWERGYVVALPPNVAPETIATLRKSATILTVIHDVDGTRGLDLRTIEPGRVGAYHALPRLPADRTLAIVYTSGTTGAPTECPKDAAQLLGEARALGLTFEPQRGTRFLATVPPHHIYGLLFGVLLPLTTGGAFLREPILHAEPLAETIHRNAVRWLVSVPAHLRSLQVLPAGRLPRLDRVVSSGAALPAATALDVKERFGWAITEVLGSSETGGIAWRDSPEADWQPFAGVTVRQGEGNRMLLESPFVSRGTPRPFVGGDRIELTRAGRFRHLGRADGIIKVGATRISVAELESKLLGLPGVTDAAVVAVEVGGSRGVETWAVVATTRYDPTEIRRALAPWLDPVVIPRRIRVVQALPRELTGKLSRERLMELFEARKPDR